MFRPLDFLGIGAPKAGTTSLHEYLRTHPDLYLPEAKEQPFFTNDEAYHEGWEAFAAVAFHGAPPGRVCGKITPHYMAGPVAWAEVADEPASLAIARRIHRTFPEVKLVAMLRDPVDRAVSSYWQTTVLGDEQRSLDAALTEELEPDALAVARVRPADGHQHIVAGEYGRILADYLRFFRRDQLFVGSTAVLAREPMKLLGDLYRFLGVGTSHVPPNIGIRYQQRGTGRRSAVIGAIPHVVKETPGLRHAWNSLPDGLRARARAQFRTAAHRLDQHTSVRDDRMDQQPEPAVLERLRAHYAEDVAQLERLVGPVPGVTDLPWLSGARTPAAPAGLP